MQQTWAKISIEGVEWYREKQRKPASKVVVATSTPRHTFYLGDRIVDIDSWYFEFTVLQHLVEIVYTGSCLL